MPITVPEGLPARKKLLEEKIFVMDESRAHTQDIRPLRILIFNLMPEKEKTELQLLRLLGNTPLQVVPTFLTTATYESKNVSKTHLDTFYHTFDEVKDQKFDGMIITGAPIEKMPFEDVQYWEELTEVMKWSETNVTSTLYICWGAQAALYHFYDIGKYELPNGKCTGIFEHRVNVPTEELVRGFNDYFLAPHSRHTGVSREKIAADDRLTILAESEEAGPFLIISNDRRHVMMTGHLEYDATTLRDEYERDMKRDPNTATMPKNYFPDNDPTKTPSNRWRAHTHHLFSNWLNYYVYQETPYDWVK